MRYLFFFFSSFVLLGCRDSGDRSEERLFESLSPESTHVQFTNSVVDDKDFNIFNYRNFYNGGGVAVGDINNDGLADVFLIANMGDNKLYLNKGNLQFEDITAKAGVAGKRDWSTGATFADVNGDGRLDLYVCNAGIRPGDDRGNELFINNGNLTFTEKAADYGLDDHGYSTHAAFFDYDRDGDLDMYLLNNSFTPVGKLGYANIRSERDSLGGHKLFRNELISSSGRSENRFTDVSEPAGIYGSLIGFGLGITIGDVNDDNWLDIYISNDFYERDYLYLNNHDGTFRESVKESMPHISLSSMGADVADVNNDGRLDIFVTDMLPGNDRRLKKTSTFENYDLQQIKLERDFHYQYMQNMLHLNQGLSPEPGQRVPTPLFSDVARFSGVHATDWSWGALIFDMDNDGWKDIFVANGVAKDVTDQDFVNFLADRENMAQIARRGNFNFKEFLDKDPSEPIPNYAFRNEGNLRFTNKAAAWGLGEPDFSNGAAYGDLDNDGDLDLIVNRVNSPVGMYRNLSVEKNKTNYLRVKLVGDAPNRDAIGTRVFVYQAGRMQVLQQMPNRGFQSSVDLTLLFGLGTADRIDSLTVIWPNDRMQTLRSPKANQLLTLRQQDARGTWKPAAPVSAPLLKDVTAASGLTYTHRESPFVDYNRDPLLKQMLSTGGPALATGDINGDGLDDLFFGGAGGKPHQLFVQRADGRFTEQTPGVMRHDTTYEAVDAEFFDADGDKDLDLFVVSGSNEFVAESEELLDRLYLNDGKGGFTRDERLPNLKASGSCVAAADFDRDGDVDLFVGTRLIPGRYGFNPASYLLTNDGTGNFKNYTKRYLPEADRLGMTTDATWADLNGDGYPELIVVGDWMPVTVFRNQRGRLVEAATPELSGTDGNASPTPASGWWNCIRAGDVDGDGDLDLVAGNLGQNSRIKATPALPAEMYTADYDQNGNVEQIINCADETGELYPMVLKQDLQKEMPSIKKKYIKFTDYAGKKLNEILDEEQLKKAVVQRVYTGASAVLLNDGRGRFTFQALPKEAQLSPVCGIEITDLDNDRRPDLVLTGNYFDVLPEIGRYDASYGLVLLNKGKNVWQPLPPTASGFFARGQVRHLKRLKQGQFVLAKNNDRAQVFK
ncbi:VCBS repeat-containing protein [Larkinella soli]|uniref:VCBS repeat-containing protein n=1 Tax=Larkinella soli TaxID=1770527 RepID=UPI000FFC6D9A|nr:VCBS repeat-containing protein [Larkinella soli]